MPGTGSRHRRSIRVGLLAAAALSVLGCAGRPVEGDASAQRPTRITAARYPVVFDAAVGMLRDEGFAVDRQDRRFGAITSEPTPSPTALEPWVGDNHSADLAWASTAGMIRRVVRVDFIRDVQADAPASDPGGAGYLVNIEVQLERLQVPTRRVLNGARGRVFTGLGAVPQPWESAGIPAAYWEPIGRDPRLERRLRAALLAHTP